MQFITPKSLAADSGERFLGPGNSAAYFAEIPFAGHLPPSIASSVPIARSPRSLWLLQYKDFACARLRFCIPPDCVTQPLCFLLVRLCCDCTLGAPLLKRAVDFLSYDVTYYYSVLGVIMLYKSPSSTTNCHAGAKTYEDVCAIRRVRGPTACRSVHTDARGMHMLSTPPGQRSTSIKPPRSVLVRENRPRLTRLQSLVPRSISVWKCELTSLRRDPITHYFAWLYPRSRMSFVRGLECKRPRVSGAAVGDISKPESEDAV